MTWTAILDKPFTVEDTNLVAYVTYTDGIRTIPSVRIPGETQDGILSAVARECLRLANVDARIATMATELSKVTVTPGPLVLPDLSKQIAANVAFTNLMKKISIAAEQKQIFDLTPFDSTIPAAAADQQTALDAIK